MTKSDKIKEAFERVWIKRKENQREVGKGTGPVAILERTINEIGWSWEKEPWSFQRKGKVDLPFLGQEDGWWKHEVRGELRDMIWRNDKAARTRRSFAGCERGVDYEATVKLYREKQGHPNKGRHDMNKKQCTQTHSFRTPGQEDGIERPHEEEQENEEKEEVEGERKEVESRGFKLDEEKRAILRTILTGAFKSGKNLKKAGIRTSEICPHCKAGEAETAEHIWWKCKAWGCKRRQWMDEYDPRQIEALPACTKKCAILTRRNELDEALKDYEQKKGQNRGHL